MRAVLRGLDLPLLLAILGLAALGMLTLYAALHQGDLSLWRKQGMVWVVGFALMLGMCFVPLRVFGLLTWPIYGLALLLLLAVPLVGEVHMGARRWLNLGLVVMQPSELMKWTLVFVLAHWFASREASQWRTVLVAVLLTALPAALIAKQPDLGTTLVLIFSATAMLIAAGLRWRVLAAALALAVALLPVIWHYMHDYQRQRVLTFLHPEADPLGAGYHVIQSTIAIGSGGLSGKGFLQGTQARLHFLPEQHTDFIFSVLAEEGGFLAACLLFALYTLLVFRVIAIAARAQNRFASMLCIGIASIFILYITVNVGMVSGLLPVVGIPLPFISYGGSALLTMLAAVGVVLRVGIEAHGHVPWQRPGSPLA
ncbi:MAG: rod shape-determining protein RodA [Zetaproteobacteria bacterium]|nr:MAG: rod shape-determining protein RodA [Zetaproteobacteria bacterium]